MVFVVKDIIVIFREIKTILIFISFKHYFSHPSLTLRRHCNSRRRPLKVKVRNKYIFLISQPNQNICCWYPKERVLKKNRLIHPNHIMLTLMGKNIFRILRSKILFTYTCVKSGNFGHQVNSDIYLQTVEIQLRRLLMSRLINIFTVCLVNGFSFQ